LRDPFLIVIFDDLYYTKGSLVFPFSCHKCIVA